MATKTSAAKTAEMTALVKEGAKNDAVSVPKGDAENQATGPKTKAETQAGKALMACTMYSGCSVSMILVNKSLASSYSHMYDGDLNVFLVVIQAVVAVVCVEICKKFKLVEYPAFNLETARLWAPVNILFCGMLFTGMASLQHNSVPMVSVFKNITNVVVTFGDRFFFGVKVEPLVLAAFSLMIGGALAAAANDLSASPLGLFWMGANVFSTAGYILYMKFATKNVKLSKFGMVFYNNVLCTLFLFPITLFNGEMNIFMSTPALHTSDYYMKNFFSGFVGFFLNFASLNCVAATGPTTYATVGSLNKIPISLLGYVLFDDVINSQTWMYIVVSMMGGFIYSYAKIRAAKQRTKESSSS
eukprot:CAMPEP_0185729482 /NCGR_PEP_ID=MMETSP1171-20130828/6057_1 /TAXON_ID=374046 /ORGANISM="Helicotheca tamensis, Strain CCMP826" /LENGTH=357 /DNA_ID=CAMNT_0028398331 /DNA_START=103 /DNA_END=1176 /DNA_ORIENTATION=-